MRRLMSTNITADLTVHHTQASDDQLVSEAKSGNCEAFAELCRRYSTILERRIFRIVRHREDSEDVLQETFLSAYLHLQSFRGTCRFSTWMTKIGINASIMLLRKRKRSLTIASEVVTEDGQRIETPEFRDPRPNPEQRYTTYQTRQILNHATRRLPPRIRSVTDMYYRKEHRLKDTADPLGISEQSAKSIIAASVLALVYGQRGTDHSLHVLAVVLGVISAVLLIATVFDPTVPTVESSHEPTSFGNNSVQPSAFR
jgi:RNA polymerase sigma-70 factor, ECF subfamily